MYWEDWCAEQYIVHVRDVCVVCIHMCACL